MREFNPQAQIDFVYDSKLLGKAAQCLLLQFCKRLNLTPIDVRVCVANQLETQEEKALFAQYEEEIENIGQGGNLGAASDILRWLSPICARGAVYTDFDVEVRLEPKRSPLIQVEKPILFNIGGVVDAEQRSIVFNNDVIAIVNHVAARPYIWAIQKAMLSAFQDYKKQSNHEVNQNIAWLKDKCGHLCPVEARRQIIENTSSMARWVAWEKGALYKVTDYLNEERQSIALMLQYPEESELPLGSEENSNAQALLDLGDSAFCERFLQRIRTSLIISHVCSTSGPYLLRKTLFAVANLPHDDFDMGIAPYSVAYYSGLKQAFKPKLPIELKMPIESWKQLKISHSGEQGDLSWTEIGAARQREREQQLIRQGKLSLTERSKRSFFSPGKPPLPPLEGARHPNDLR